MSNGGCPTPRSTEHKNIPTHVSRRLFGPNLFEWSEKASPTVLFRDSVNHESRMFRHFMITGWQSINQRNSSLSSIGGPPQSQEGDSESVDNESVISDRTVITAINRNRTPAPPSAPPAYRRTGPAYRRARVAHARDESQSFSRNWTFPGAPAEQTTRAPPIPIEQETPTRRSRAPRVRPYRPPQLRNSASERNPFLEGGGTGDRGHRMSLSLESLGPPPTYRMPHTTAHNVRSQSYSYPVDQGPVLPPNPQHSRSHSDVFHEFSQIDSSVFGSLREIYGDGSQRGEPEPEPDQC